MTRATLRTLGAHPVGGAEVKLMDGRYGPYVTDGQTNASVPKTADPATLTLEQAVELLKARAEAGPSARRPRGRAAAGAAKRTGARRASSSPRQKAAN
jgi:DNA topoisomerase-1